MAQDLQLERNVAIKLLSTELAQETSFRNRFLLEAKAASALSHGNVCIIYEVGEAEQGRLYIVMEQVDGRSLASMVREASIDLSTVVEIGVQVAEALVAAHGRGIIHRDIKPVKIRRRTHAVGHGESGPPLLEALRDTKRWFR